MMDANQHADLFQAVAEGGQFLPQNWMLFDERTFGAV